MDRSTVHICRVPEQGAFEALAASVPGWPGQNGEGFSGNWETVKDRKVNVGTSVAKPALPRLFHVRCWTGAHQEHARPNINLVE